MAEQHAWEYAKESGLDLVTLCPTMNLGPMLQGNVNDSSMFLFNLLKGGKETIQNVIHAIVDLRDVAEASVLVYECSEASGRYICNAHQMRARDLVEILKRLYPHYNYPKQFINVAHDMHVSSKKLQSLGWSFRPLEETLADAVQCFCELGLLG
ncbi:cinnamoyl-CoA reductase 1-like [Nymphaea colorata]|nr:cinnamoyl-CoA reductase 1-like [Nymphaea colorata]